MAEGILRFTTQLETYLGDKWVKKHIRLEGWHARLMLSPFRASVVDIEGRFAASSASHPGLVKGYIPLGGNLYIVQAEVYSRIE